MFEQFYQIYLLDSSVSNAAFINKWNWNPHVWESEFLANIALGSKLNWNSEHIFLLKISLIFYLLDCLISSCRSLTQRVEHSDTGSHVQRELQESAIPAADPHILLQEVRQEGSRQLAYELCPPLLREDWLLSPSCTSELTGWVILDGSCLSHILCPMYIGSWSHSDGCVVVWI